MTFQEFKKMTYGVDVWQVYFNGKWIVGTDTLDSKYMDMTVIEFDFDADYNGRITCTVDLKENS
jgi:hypothetical protein